MIAPVAAVDPRKRATTTTPHTFLYSGFLPSGNRSGNYILDCHMRRVHTGLLTVLLIGWLAIRWRAISPNGVVRWLKI